MRGLSEKSKLISFYEYLFYKIYKFMCWPNSRNRGLQYGVVVWMAAFFCTNIFIIFGIYDCIMQKQTLSLIMGAPQISGFIFVFAFIIFYFLFIFKNKYIKIINYYRGESEVESKRGDFFAWAYIFISMFGLVMLILFRMIADSIHGLM